VTGESWKVRETLEELIEELVEDRKYQQLPVGWSNKLEQNMREVALPFFAFFPGNTITSLIAFLKETS
jgi:hypothetical protein